MKLSSKKTTFHEKRLVLNGRNQANSDTQSEAASDTATPFLTDTQHHPGLVHTLQPPGILLQSYHLWQKGGLMWHIGTLPSYSLHSVCEKQSTALTFPFRCLHLLSTLQKETPHSLPAFLALTRLVFSPFAVTVTPLPCTLIIYSYRYSCSYSQTISAGSYYPKEIIWTKNS